MLVTMPVSPEEKLVPVARADGLPEAEG